MNLKSLIRKTGLVTLATMLLNFSSIKSQNLEERLYGGTDNFFEQYLDERLYLKEDIYDKRLYEYRGLGNLNSSNSLTIRNDLLEKNKALKANTQENRSDTKSEYNESIIKMWEGSTFFSIGWGFPRFLFIPTINPFLYNTYKVLDVKLPFFGISLLEGDYGEEHISSYFPLYMNIPFRAREYERENGLDIGTVSSIFVGGSAWAIPREQRSAHNRFGGHSYIKIGMRHLIVKDIRLGFDDDEIMGPSLEYEGGMISIEDPFTNKFDKYFYFSVNIGLSLVHEL